jgi:hypothetical protein
MKLKNIFLAFLVLFVGSSAWAQAYKEAKQPRILILLDGSSSMLQPWTAKEDRFKAASKIISALIDSVYKVNDQVEFALRVYGHQHPSQDNNCFDTRLEVMFSKDNLTQMSLRLDALHPYGVSPIAFSIKQSAEQDMQDIDHNEYSLILITDGGESCGGNICDVVKTLLEKKINFKPYIVSLVDYAPLRDQYNCLGNYLLVTSEKDLKPTVGTIVEAYRPMITLKTIDKKLIDAVVANPPSVLKVSAPTIKIDIQPEPIEQKKVNIPAPKAETPPTIIPEVVEAIPAKDITNRTFDRPPYESIRRMNPSATTHFLPQKYTTRAFNKITVAKYIPPPPVIDPPPAAPVVAVAPPPKKKVAEVVAPPTPSKVEATNEPAKETTLELYFWDGKGKFYQTSPQITLTNVKTKQVHKFYRTVDPSGNPDPRTDIPPGVYELTIAKSKVFVANLEVKPNEKNIRKIVAGKASLRFEYEDNTQQPVKEYVAQVKKNFEPGPVIDQYCYQELEYEPGNYHIIINTLPKSHKSVDLEFDAIVTIRIEKPGYVQFMNTEALGKINLYYELGDQFIKFSHSLELTGDPEQQKLELQRGRYRVGYYKQPKGPEIIREFIVKSKQIAEVRLD